MKNDSGSEEFSAYKVSCDKCVMWYTSPSARLTGPQRIVLVNVYIAGWCFVFWDIRKTSIGIFQLLTILCLSEGRCRNTNPAREIAFDCSDVHCAAKQKYGMNICFNF